MSSKERKERIRKQVYTAILKTARDIARKDGWQAVSIRKIADVIEYSPPVLYEYFENKDKLLEAVRNDGFLTLKAQFIQIKELYRNPEKQLLEIATAIWDFAKAQPEVFQVMFNSEGAFCQSKNIFLSELDYRSNPVWEIISTYRPRSPDAVTRTLYEWWVTTYGFITLMMTIRSFQDGLDYETIYRENVRRYLRSIL